MKTPNKFSSDKDYKTHEVASIMTTIPKNIKWELKVLAAQLGTTQKDLIIYSLRNTIKNPPEAQEPEEKTSFTFLNDKGEEEIVEVAKTTFDDFEG